MNIKIGSNIGNWEVISEKYVKDNVQWFDCVCICGTKKSVRSWHLNNNKTFSCGCTNTKGRFKAICVGDLSLSYYNSFKTKRLKKNIFFSEDITMEFLWDLFLKQNKKCALSGIEIILNPRWSQQNHNRKSELKQTASIDRIDNKLGYIIGNVQWVHKDINNIKGSLDENDLLYYCEQIIKTNSIKNLGYLST
jgi:hypothetical protein